METRSVLLCGAVLSLAAASAVHGAAKNVILMISDGAGDTTWKAANQWQFGPSAGTAPQFQQRFEGAGFNKHWVSTYAGHSQPLPPGQVDVRLGLPAGSLPRYLPRLYNEIPFPNAGSYDPARASDTTPGNVHLFTDRNRTLYPNRGTPYTLTPVASNSPTIRGLANQLQAAGTVTVNRQTGPLAYDYLIWDSVTDSASAGTALASGRKTYSSAINFVDTGDTLSPVPFLTQQVKALGKKAGVVTTKPFTDATPAVFGTQNVFRDNEAEISNAMISNGLLDVIISPGHPEFGLGGAPRTPNYSTVSQANLASLRAGTAGGSAPWTFVDSNDQLRAIASGTQPAPDRLFGLVPVASALNSRDTTGQTNAFDPRVHTPGNIPAGVVPFVMPDLHELASAALNTLNTDPDGFFVMIEGASVDSAAHANNLPQLVEEQLAFNRAVDKVIDWVETNSSWEETLLIVTTDHANGLFLGPDSATIPFQDPLATEAGQLPQGIFWTTNHTNELVPMWTRGPGSEMFASLFDGTDPRRGLYLDNTDIHSVMVSAIPEPAALSVLAVFPLVARRRR
jgi:alkaline phosphatase